jgi:DNA-binding winged helix-turn-helix (wHTH) protein/Tfp pilus assembly protein PilF
MGDGGLVFSVGRFGRHGIRSASEHLTKWLGLVRNDTVGAMRRDSFSIGAWQVDVGRGALIGQGREVRLEPRQLDLLLALVDAKNRVVSKDEIIARVWGGRAIGDDTIASAISRLRAALGETKQERYIETLPKRGYRLVVSTDRERAVAPVHEAGNEVEALVRRGYAELRTMLPSALAQARLYFVGALKQDPRSAEAHAGIAETMLALLMTGQGSAPALLVAAKSSAQTSVTLNENLAAGWSVLGLARLFGDREFGPADDAFLRAIRLDGAMASAHRGRTFALASVGRLAEAEREARRSAEIEPLSFATRNDLLQILIAARKYAHAIAEAKRALALGGSTFQAWSAKGWAEVFIGETDNGVSSLLESLRAMGSGEATVEKLRATYSEQGFEAFCARGADLFESQRLLFTPRALDIAMLCIQSGDNKRAFAQLEKAASQGDPVLLFARYLPHLDRVRNDPRFARLIERVGVVS